MNALSQILARWHLGLEIAAALAFVGLVFGANYYRHAYHDEQDLRTADKARYIAAQEEAGRIAQAALAHTEAVYRAQAQDTDHAYSVELADARTAADRYIAAHYVAARRVRGEAPARDAGGSPAPADDHGTSLPQGLPADAVVVGAGDVQACSALYPYAVKAHDWAMSLDAHE